MVETFFCLQEQTTTIAATKMTKREATTSFRKGAPIRFVAGKYAGKKGWLNLNEEGDSLISPVVVNLGRKHGERATYAYHTSFKEEDEIKNPSSYAEAALQQQPHLERALVTTCRIMAQCDAENNINAFKALFSKYLNDAVKGQKDKGHLANYKKIEYRK